MKRTIAITLSALALAFSMIGCGSKNTGNVSETPNGTVNNSTGQYRSNNENRHSEAQADKETNTNTNETRRDTQNDSFMDDMENAVQDAGQAVGDAGRAVGDMVTGNDNTDTAHNSNAGTGMTGGR